MKQKYALQWKADGEWFVRYDGLEAFWSNHRADRKVFNSLHEARDARSGAAFGHVGYWWDKRTVAIVKVRP